MLSAVQDCSTPGETVPKFLRLRRFCRVLSSFHPGLSELAPLLFRCTGHDDMWGADYFGRMEYATEYFVKARRAGG